MVSREILPEAPGREYLPPDRAAATLRRLRWESGGLWYHERGPRGHPTEIRRRQRSEAQLEVWTPTAVGIGPDRWYTLSREESEHD